MRTLKNSVFALCLAVAILGTTTSSLQADEPVSQANGQITAPSRNMIPGEVMSRFRDHSSRIDARVINELPMQSRGRVKPLDSFAREAVLFLTGKYSFAGLDPVQAYLGLITFVDLNYLEAINVRDPELRVTLGFTKEDRYLSLNQLEHSRLMAIAQPILDKQKQNERLVTPDDKKILEVVQQVWLLKDIVSGGNFLHGVVLDVTHPEQAMTSPLIGKGKEYLQAIANWDSGAASISARDLLALARSQSMPDLFRPSLDKVGLEVTYNQARPFFWSGLLYLILGALLVARLPQDILTRKRVFAALSLPLLLHIVGFGVRVYITGFAPVTSMYGTMVWMAFGVVTFGALLFALYGNAVIYGLLLMGASATLLLTESIPLILSPDMDPIVAVLRNNFWLTIHVMTISISYAAFTIAMLIGNIALVRGMLPKLRAQSKEALKAQSHLAYRAIQLGVFLLTAGIILGGWWADYSWGRFWGWDPKETWALIADLGFLSILHARYAGWLGDFGLLASAPLAYLLVLMAWYGVNFILAAGLHSYGFSSGGTTIVVSFVVAQLVLFAAAMGSRYMRRSESLERKPV